MAVVGELGVGEEVAESRKAGGCKTRTRSGYGTAVVRRLARETAAVRAANGLERHVIVAAVLINGRYIVIISDGQYLKPA